jgi:hypothetical protein
MMRAQLLAIPPDPPSSVTATRSGSGNNQRVVVRWVDGSVNETGFTVQRATSLNGPWLSLTPAAPTAPRTGMTLSYTDATIARRTTFYYRVIANKVIGDTQTYATSAIGFPTLSADSAPVNAAAPITTLFAPNQEEAPIFADSFETGLAQWSGVIGNVQIDPQAVIGLAGGSLGMATNVGEGSPAYVYDTTPDGEVMYDANFYFDPNGATSNDSPIDIFIGLDQDGQPTFGVQFQTELTSTYEIRGWVMQNGAPVFTAWDKLTPEESEDIISNIHKIDIAWQSGASAGFSLYIDDTLFTTLNGDTSAYQLDEVLLGPSLGLTASASGTLYFDEFTSSKVNGIQYNLYLPSLVSQEMEDKP